MAFKASYGDLCGFQWSHWAGSRCPLVGGGHVERLDCNLAQDDPGEREGDAGRRVVEMREHQEVPTVEANRVQGFV